MENDSNINQFYYSMKKYNYNKNIEKNILIANK